ncbi:MAG TPA: lyase family protein, partial [Tepidiformaceae bacterium]|nr:lyase family protein [Tepidiformaceae bacterium]
LLNRMLVRELCEQAAAAARELALVLCELAERHAADPMPGYTHVQRAQPITLGHHLLAYGEMLARDRERFIDCRRRTNVMPLGSGALAGSPYPLDREMVARELGFDSISRNSLDATADRDFVAEFCAQNGREPLRVSARVLNALQQHAWPGNIRELRNRIESMVV